MSKATENTEIINRTFDAAELDYIKEGLQRSYKERFLMTTRLYKIQKTSQKAKLTHKPFIAK